MQTQNIQIQLYRLLSLIIAKLYLLYMQYNIKMSPVFWLI